MLTQQLNVLLGRILLGFDQSGVPPSKGWRQSYSLARSVPFSGKHYLQDLLIFFGMCLFYLFGSSDVVFNVTACMLVSLQALEQNV